MAGVTITLDTREFDRAIKRLGDAEVGRAMAKALNRTAFEIREAEGAEARRVFKFAGPQTQTFIASPSAFVFDGAKPDKLQVTIKPRQKAGSILSRQQAGARLTPSDRASLTVDGELAIPSGDRIRSARGKVPKRLTPAELLRKRGKKGRARGYRAGRYIFEAVKGSRSKLRFVLEPSVKLPAIFEFYRAAKDAALKHFPVKAREEFAKIRL